MADFQTGTEFDRGIIVRVRNELTGKVSQFDNILGEGLKINFSFEKNYNQSSSTDSGSITISGMSYETFKGLGTRFHSEVEVYVGYLKDSNSPLKLLFKADITNMAYTKSVGGTEAVLTVSSNFLKLTASSALSTTMPEGYTNADIFGTLSTLLSVTFNTTSVGEDILNTAHPWGYAAHGYAKDVLDELCRANCLSWVMTTAPISTTATETPKPSKGKSSNSLASIGIITSTYSKQYNVEEALIKAVIKTESGGDTTAKSPVGAVGLMQLMPATATRFGTLSSERTIPSKNVSAGTQYLSFLYKRYKGDLDKTIAAYNAGEGNVDKYKGIPPFRETQDYVKRVKANLAVFRGENPSLTAPVGGDIVLTDIRVAQDATPYEIGNCLVLSEATGLISLPYLKTKIVSESMDEVKANESEEVLNTDPNKTSSSNKTKVQRTSVHFKALINPQVMPNSVVKIVTGTDIDGVYRVRDVQFSGDTHGQDWYMEADCDYLVNNSQTANEVTGE